MMDSKKLIPMLPTKNDQTDRSVIPSVLGTVANYIEILDRGATERELVRARSNAVSAMLRERREVMVGYLSQRFGERNKLYNGYFALIDKALDAGNDDVVKLALESLLQVYLSPATDGVERLSKEIVRLSEAKAG